MKAESTALVGIAISLLLSGTACVDSQEAKGSTGMILIARVSGAPKCILPVKKLLREHQIASELGGSVEYDILVDASKVDEAIALLKGNKLEGCPIDFDL